MISGATHKAEWDKYVRAAANRSKFPVQLADFYMSNKVELFNFWLDSNQDWHSCELMVKRSVEAKNTSLKGWHAVQGRDLRAKYSEEKFNKIVEARKASNMYYEDEEFPGDLDEPRLD